MLILPIHFQLIYHSHQISFSPDCLLLLSLTFSWTLSKVTGWEDHISPIPISQMRTQRPRGRHRAKVCSELDAELGLKSRSVCKASGGVLTAVQSEDTQLNLNFKE